MDATDPVWGFSPAGASGFFLGLDELAQVNVLTQTFNKADKGATREDHGMVRINHSFSNTHSAFALHRRWQFFSGAIRRNSAGHLRAGVPDLSHGA
jgi:hypothetical protein